MARPQASNWLLMNSNSLMASRLNLARPTAGSAFQTQGSSGGLQVNAVTKAGTNVLSGTLAGVLPGQQFKRADFVAKRVMPPSDQQVSTTFGGPIKKDRAHIFFYQGEREGHLSQMDNNVIVIGTHVSNIPSISWFLRRTPCLE
jgi:hypothetical protein